MDKAIFILTLLVFSLLTVLDGSRNPVIALLFSSAFMILLALRLLVPAKSVESGRRRFRVVLIAAIPLGGWLCFTWLQAAGVLVGSADAYASWTEFYLACGYVSAWMLLVAQLQSPMRLNVFAGVVTLVAVFQVFYGMANYYSSSPAFGWAPTHYAFHRVTGTYVNRNFFANLVVMSSGFALIWLLTRHPSRAVADKDILPTEVSFVRLGAAVILSLLCSGLLLSGSRGGMVSFAGASLLTALLLIPMRHIRVSLWPLALTGVATAILFGAGSMLFRFSNVGIDMADRLEQWKTTLTIAAASPWTGYGAGTYEAVFRNRQSGELGSLTYNHAHNDYLELLFEQGILGIFLAGLAIVFILSIGIRRVFNCRSVQRKRWILSSLFGISAIFLHAMVDFPLQVPANVWLSMALLAILTSASTIEFKPQADQRRIPPGRTG
ncbi:MAG: O-antigen ligase family protein [Gammaproteobacteria bacterium]|nr:O-antigen ligase family protein [Gammaproteobacteria bacterium]